MRAARLTALTPNLGGRPSRSHEAKRPSSFHPRHVFTPRDEEDGDYPSPRRGEGVFDWWLTFQQTPCQMTAYVSPATCLARALWIFVVYLVILRMCPVPEVAASVKGVSGFINDLTFAPVAPAPAPAAPALDSAADVLAVAPADEVAPADAAEAPVLANATRNATPAAALPTPAANGTNGTSVLWRRRLLRRSEQLVLLQEPPDSHAGTADSAPAMPVMPDVENEGSTIQDVATLDDVVQFTKSLVGGLFETDSYNGKNADPLMLLRVHRLLSSLVVSQRRVHTSDCAYEMLKPFYPECYGELTEESEDTRGWQGVPYDNVLHAVALQMPLDRDIALEQIRELVKVHWWDRATRETAVSFVFHNAPGHFTGYCQVGFTLSPYGSVKSDIDVSFLRLQPYAAEVDGWKLIAFQSLAAVLLAVLAFEVVYLARQQVHVRWSVAYMLRPWALFDYVLLVWLTVACVAWKGFLDDPARTRFSPVTGAPEFTDLAQMAERFSGITFVLSVILLMSVIRMVEYLTMMPEVGEMYRVLAKAVSDMGYFTIILLLLFGGFAVAGHLLFGPTVVMFKSLDSTMHHLILWFFALGGGHEELFERPGGVLFLLLFMFALMIVLFNMLLGIVTNAFDTVAEEEKEHILVKPWNHRAGDWVCDFLNVPPFSDDPYNSPEKFGFHPDISARTDEGDDEAPPLDAAPRRAQ